MNLAVVVEIVPSTLHGGGGITAFTTIAGFISNGCSVTVLVLKGGREKFIEATEILEMMGAKVLFLELDSEGSHPKNFFLRIGPKIIPSFSNIFPNLKYKEPVKKALNDLSPDFIYCYHWEAAAAVFGITDFKKIVTVGDPIHLPSLYRRSLHKHLERKVNIKKRLYYAWLDIVWLPRQKLAMIRLLNDFDIKGAFAAHHAYELKKMGVKDCKYFHTPVPEVEKRYQLKNEKFKIVLMGVLVGIATLSGIKVFIEDIYPKLVEKIGPENFEVHVVGGGFDTMPISLQLGLNKSNIFIRGQVNPADNEFLTADVLLVPTPIELGIRVRIITAFSFGTLVVAHKANQKGIPELEDGINCFIANDGLGMAKRIFAVYSNDDNVAGIKVNAREMFNKIFNADAFFAEINAEIERLS
jgi:glycosyltransferase involved in cell wall biosynthesis